MPSSLLQVGTVEQVKDYCRRLIEECAPGGGFIYSLVVSVVGAVIVLVAYHALLGRRRL